LAQGWWVGWVHDNFNVSSFIAPGKPWIPFRTRTGRPVISHFVSSIESRCPFTKTPNDVQVERGNRLSANDPAQQGPSQQIAVASSDQAGKRSIDRSQHHPRASFPRFDPSDLPQRYLVASLLQELYFTVNFPSSNVKRTQASHHGRRRLGFRR
jgi:hypothetical protein